MLIERLKLKNLLSFGPDGIDIELRKFNLLIGPNGSGKSNLIEAINLLRAMPRDLAEPIREGGGISEWLWRGGGSPAKATIQTLIRSNSRACICHTLEFGKVGQQFEVINERIEDGRAGSNGNASIFYVNEAYRTLPRIRTKRRLTGIGLADLDLRQSILAQRRDPKQFPEMTQLGDFYKRIAIYREWTSGRDNPLRESQKTDLRNDHVSPHGSNLALVLNRMKRQPTIKRRLIESMQKLLDGLADFDVVVDGGRIQLSLDEGPFSVPSSWLSDGTLRYLFILAVLLDPEPPALVCIDEPELGLHPDAIASLADLLIDASERMQLVVSTHSPLLLDSVNRRVEDVVVCERHEGHTLMRRLEQREMSKWLKKYSLSELWSSGQIGGNRW